MNKRFLKQSAYTIDSDNVYFNVSITSDNEKRITKANYSATRTRNIIDKASDYYVSLIRFTIPAFYVPVLVVPLDNEETGETAYQVSLQYDGNFSDYKLIYSNTGDVAPGSPSNYMFYYSQLVRMINMGYAQAYNNLPTKPAGSGPPFIIFDSQAQLFTLYAKYDFYDEGLGANRINVFMNDQLYSLFGSFYANRISSGYDFAPSGRDVRLLFVNLRNNVVDAIDPADPDTYIVNIQDYVSLYNWNPYKRIVVVSNSLPIEGESVLGSGDAFLKVLTDFEPTNDITDTRSVYQYVPSGQYRFIDMTSDSPIRDVDLQVWWQDIEGNLQPIWLPYDSQITIKIGFFHKSLYNNNWGALR